MQASALAQRWKRWTEVPLALAAVVFLGAYSWPVLDPGMDPALAEACEWVAWGVWGLFVVDYAVRFTTYRDRWAFVRSHWFDLAVITLPVLRPLRLLRMLTLLDLLRHTVLASLRGKVAIYTTASTVLLCYCAAVAVLDAEQDAPGANITTFGDALWWTAVTITTVGYGDYYPVTVAGRLVALVLFLAGIALLGVVTAMLATWLVEQVKPESTAGGGAE